MVLTLWYDLAATQQTRSCEKYKREIDRVHSFFPSYDTRQALLLPPLPLLKLDPWSAQPIRALAGRDWPILGMMAREQGLALVLSTTEYVRSTMYSPSISGSSMLLQMDHGHSISCLMFEF